MFILSNKNLFDLNSQDAEKEVLKLEKEIKPEKREKTKKYTNAQKQLKTRQIRHEDTHSLAIKVNRFVITYSHIVTFLDTAGVYSLH